MHQGLFRESTRPLSAKFPELRFEVFATGIEFASFLQYRDYICPISGYKSSDSISPTTHPAF
jgi:hypothetical protein